MKKLSFFLMAMLISLVSFAAETTATLSFADKAQRTVFNSNQQVWTQNGITLTNDKAASTNAVADYAKPARFYAGSKLTVSCEGTIKQIVFDCNSSSYATTLKNSITSGATVTVSSDKVTAVPTTEASEFVVAKLTAQVRMDAITVTYAAEEENPDATIYTITATSADETMGTVAGAGEYAEGKTVTLTANANPGYEFVKWSNESTENPLIFEATENVTLTASFVAQTPITIAEANKLGDSKTAVLNEFTVTYVYKSYIHIQDASGYGMIFQSNFGLKVGDVVSGLTCSKSTYNGLPQFIPTCKLADLTIEAGEAPAVVELTTAPTGNYHQVVKLMNLRMTGSFVTDSYSTINATCPDGKTIAIYNAKNNLAYTFVADKTYNITGDVCQYSGKIQVSVYAIEEYVAPEPCTLATPVNWDAPIAAEANTDQWYAVNVASAIAAGKDLALTVTNPGTEAVEITIEAYADCPATEKIAGATSTIAAGATKTTTIKFDEFLADQVEVVYFHVVSSGDLTVGAEAIEPCSKATAINWDDAINAEANTDKWYAVNLASAIAAGKDIELTIANPGTEAVEITAEAYANCPATEKIAGATSTINAGATKTTTIKFDEFLADQVDVVYFHIVTVGGELNVEAETAKFNVTATAENGTVEGAGIYEQGAEATLTATPAEGYEFVNWTVAGEEVSTENPYKFTVTADVALVANFKKAAPAMETVYFVNAQGWTGTIKAYAWDPANAAWPGVAATKEAEQIGGYDVYSYTAEAGKYANVIFNGTGGQTADLKWTAGKYYVLDGWYTKEEAEAKLATPIVDEVVYFVNNKKWSKVNAYAWEPANAAWPGKAATKEAEQIGGFDVYSYSAAPGTYQKVIFNDGGSNQTADMVWTAGKYIVNNKWYTKDEAEAALAAPVVTTWTMVGDKALFGTDWDLNATANDLVKQEDGSWVLTLTNKTLAAKSYEYKAAKDRSWTTTVPGGNNAKLTISKAGQYDVTFTLNAAATSVTAKVTYIPAKYNVTVTTENGTVTGAGEYEEGATATLTATAAEGYEFVNWTVGEEVVSTENPYSFVVTADVALVANFELVPVVEPEKPEPTYTDNNLNPYAFGLESKLSADQSVLNVTYRLNNSKATDVDVVVYNGTEVIKVVAGTANLGKNTVEIATADLPGGVELTWAVIVNGTSVDAPTQETKMYSMYCPHGLAIDKDPESEYFGRILAAEGMQAVPASGYMTSGKGAGIYVFNPSFTTDSVVYKGGNDFTRVWASNGYQPWRVKISEDGRIFVSSLDLNGVVVWEVSKDLQTWTPVIAGTQGENGNILDAEGNFVAGMNVSMDVVGSGENLKLLLYSCTTSASAFSQSAFRLDEYALGTATTWTGTPKNILTGGKYALVHTNAEWIYDGEGGYWFGASRAGNAGQPNLAHINAAGVQDYYTEDASLYGGDGVLVHNGMLFKGKARSSSTVGNFGVWTIGKDAEGNTTLTEKWSVSANGIGRNLNEFAVDYAENLYVVGNSGEKIIAYALPYSGTVETPAASKYAFQLEGEAVEYTEIVMSNLVVTPYGAFDLLEASDAMTGIAVMLGVDADGKLIEGSEVTWNGTSMTILSSGVFTKAYNDELATDVYNGKLVIEFYGEEMGLDLYMYGTGAASSVDVVITDANITVDEWGSYLVSAPWEDGILTIEVSDTEYEGFMMIEYTITEDDWYIWMAYTATVTTVDNVMTIEGEFTDNYTGTTYNVTISGNLPNGTGTGLEDATVTIKAVKKIQNGQLIIEKDGVQYNANGAQL